MLQATIWRVGAASDRDELEQVARIAFFRAVERFDLRQPWRLATYAKRWVDGELRRYVGAAGLVIEVPRRKAQLIRRVEASRSRLAGQLGREPSLRELAADVSLSPREVEDSTLVPRKAWSLDQVADGETGVGWGRSGPLPQSRFRGHK